MCLKAEEEGKVSQYPASITPFRYPTKDIGGLVSSRRETLRTVVLFFRGAVVMERIDLLVDCHGSSIQL